MKIPLSARVICQEGVCGTLSLLVIDSRHSRLDQLVVETHPPNEGTLPQDRRIPVERLVPADWLVGMEDHTIRLRCSNAQIQACPPLRHSVQIGDPAVMFRIAPDAYQAWPYFYVVSQSAEKVNLPPGEVWLDRRAGVITRDERQVGKVAGLELDPTSKRLTGLAIYEGHFWDKREVMLPITHVNRFEEDTVYINQVYRKVSQLPGSPVH